MKKIIFLFALIISFVCTVAFKNSTVNTFPLFGKLIILDPGHGNEDPGTMYNKEYEKDYNLVFANSLKKKLENLGCSVLMTREGDYDLSNPSSKSRKRTDFNNRIKLIDESGADLYISLHMNYLNNSKYFGAQAFYSSKNEENKILADLLQEKFNDFFSFSKETKKIGTDKYMYQRINTRGVLIEYGFMSNSKDRNNLKSENYRNDLATVIADGIIKFFT